MLKKFKDFLHPPAHSEHSSYDDHSDEQLIEKFHAAHKQLEELGHHLHKRGHHIEIEYKSHLAARHGREGRGSTLFFNQALLSPKKVSVSKSAIAVKRVK